MVANEAADSNIVLTASDSWEDQRRKVSDEVGQVLGSEKLNGVICVAGGWAGGSISSADLVRNCDLMWKQSVWTSVIAGNVASTYLEPNGLVVLTGAVPALQGTPGMVAYGMAKAAVHQLVRSLAEEGSGLGKDSAVVAILPITLDTPANRKHIKGADTSTWTPLDTVAKLFYGWMTSGERPKSGSLCQLITENNNTTVVTDGE